MDDVAPTEQGCLDFAVVLVERADAERFRDLVVAEWFVCFAESVEDAVAHTCGVLVDVGDRFAECADVVALVDSLGPEVPADLRCSSYASVSECAVVGGFVDQVVEQTGFLAELGECFFKCGELLGGGGCGRFGTFALGADEFLVVGADRLFELIDRFGCDLVGDREGASCRLEFFLPVGET